MVNWWLFPRGFKLSGQSNGFTLVETLIAMTIFSVLIAGIYGAYISQMRHSVREYRNAESEIELLIAKSLIERDIQMTGFGLAEDFGGPISTKINPSDASPTELTDAQLHPYQATNGNPDTLILLGTGLGISKEAQRWTFLTPVANFHDQADTREKLEVDDKVVVLEPSSKKLLRGNGGGGDWLFSYKATVENPGLPLVSVQEGTAFNIPIGSLVYGVGNDEATVTQPFVAVRYYRGSGTSPSGCAPGTNSLLRGESTSALVPSGSGIAHPILACMRDFQVAFGLDTGEDGTIDQWDNGGQIAADYTHDQFRKRVREIRIYILAHYGSRDPEYTYPNATIRVGETALGTGRDITLTAAQRQYRWKLISLNATPRNLR